MKRFYCIVNYNYYISANGLVLSLSNIGNKKPMYFNTPIEIKNKIDRLRMRGFNVKTYDIIEKK